MAGENLSVTQCATVPSPPNRTKVRSVVCQKTTFLSMIFSKFARHPEYRKNNHPWVVIQSGITDLSPRWNGRARGQHQIAARDMERSTQLRRSIFAEPRVRRVPAIAAGNWLLH